MYNKPGFTLCRLCLSSGGRLQDVFEENNNLEFMVHKTIEELLQLKVTNDTAYPWLVCYHCVEKLTEFRLFKHRCFEAQFVFLNRIENGNDHKNWETGPEAPPLNEETCLDVSDVNELIRVDTRGATKDADAVPGSALQNCSVMEAIIASDLRGNDEISPFSSRDADTDPVTSAGLIEMEIRPHLNEVTSCLDASDVNELIRVDTRGGTKDADAVPGSAWQNGCVMEAIIASDIQGNDEISPFSSRDADTDPVTSAGLIEMDIKTPLKAEESLIGVPVVNDVTSSFVEHLKIEPEILVVSNDEMEIGVKDEIIDFSEALVEDVAERDDFNVLEVSKYNPVTCGVPFEEVSTDICPPGKKLFEFKEEYVVDQPQGPLADSSHIIPTRLCSLSGKKKSGVPVQESTSSASVAQDGMRNELADEINAGEGKIEESVINLVSSTINKGVTMLPTLPQDEGGEMKKVPQSQCGASKESNISNPKMCTLCGKKFSIKISLQKHMYKVHLGVKHQSNSFSVEAHPPREGSEGNTVDETKSCSLCSKMFHHVNDLVEHMAIHKHEKRYSCDVCFRSFIRKENLRKHMEEHSSENLPCNPNACSSRNAFEGHTSSCMAEKARICNVCLQSFSRECVFRDHMAGHTKERPYSCSLCYKVFSKSFCLKRHIEKHSVDRPFACNVCSKLFSRKESLKYHLIGHLNGKSSHLCSECGKSFGTALKLSKHVASHAVNRPYTCSLCLKPFAGKYFLQRHMAHHNEERTFSCTVCSKKFGRKDGLSVHMAVHTVERPYACNICSKTYKLRSYLQKHMKQHHV